MHLPKLVQECDCSLDFRGRGRLLPRSAVTGLGPLWNRGRCLVDMLCWRNGLPSHDKRVGFHPPCVLSYDSERPIHNLGYFAIGVTKPLVSLNYFDLFWRQLSRGTP